MEKSAEAWDSWRGILGRGKRGDESTTGRHKIGDGISTWRALNYAEEIAAFFKNIEFETDGSDSIQNFELESEGVLPSWASLVDGKPSIQEGFYYLGVSAKGSFEFFESFYGANANLSVAGRSFGFNINNDLLPPQTLILDQRNGFDVTTVLPDDFPSQTFYAGGYSDAGNQDVIEGSIIRFKVRVVYRRVISPLELN